MRPKFGVKPFDEAHPTRGRKELMLVRRNRARAPGGVGGRYDISSVIKI